MAFTFDSTLQGGSANSYISTASAVDILGGDLNATEFLATVTASQEKLLVMATQRLEEESYRGSPTSTAQALKWPRIGVPDQRYSGGAVAGTLYYGLATYDSTLMPAPLLRAVCCLAAALCKDTALLGDTGLEGFEHVQVGPLDVTPRFGRKAGSLPADVVRYLRGLRTSTEGSIAVVRG
jgi:hypothetical protein